MRNHPEEYLTVLKKHFSKVPSMVCPESKLSSTLASIEQEDDSLRTTNQNGKFTAFQRWFTFKEAFAPSFVIGAIERLGYWPTHIIDPFGGMGTTAITAQLLDINVTTIEINPFSADLISAKATPIPLEALNQISTDFYERLAKTPENLNLLAHLPPTFVEGAQKDRWIFSENVAKRISQYLGVITDYKDPDIKRLLKVILGSTLIPSSNVYINGKGRRYRRNWKENQPTTQVLDDLFKKQLEIVLEDNRIFQHRPNGIVSVHNDDSRVVLSGLNETTDLIVFSPPYPNSFDYTDIYNVELWVLGYLKNASDNSTLRKQTLRSHVQAKRPFDQPKNTSEILNKTYSDLKTVRVDLWNKNIPEMVTAYFKDLEDILLHSYRLLKPKGKVIMVVGDSKYSNVLIDVAGILIEIARALGYKEVSKQEVRKMRTSAQQGGTHQLGEWIIELTK
ncbi:hypothetical protein SAMN05192566_2081 [Methylophilus rhizosphaerae]|uniref:DNA methylase n=1 Tax=Methylophilus rhizosphaerae TaxID=492660 RepID=A0A1G9DZQ1_9PROT|nr:site-specific DNA-methyltransferase [Methylophilus rhizosphaerae]SDK69344.1 hypothetical protein SAMN05192566_2081 [Methylophilus rhizosphaerae]